MAGFPDAGAPFSHFAMQLSRRDPLEYVRTRREEDVRAIGAIGAHAVHFNFPDAPYRTDWTGQPLYPDVTALFHKVDLRELYLVNQIADALRAPLRPGDTLLVPSAICGHVDHLLTRVACEMLPNRLLFYDEFPYTLRAGAAVAPEVQSEWAEWIGAYASQKDLLFPGNALRHLLSVHRPELMELPRLVPCIPRTLHCIWVGDAPLPPAARHNLDTWAELLGQQWQIKLWTNADLTDAVLPGPVWSKVVEAPHGIQKADILRYHILSKYGGWYMDLDFEPVQSLEPIALLLHQETLILCNEEEHLIDKVSNGCFACTPGHPSITRTAEAVLTQPLNTGPFDMMHIVTHTGPVLFNTMLRDAHCVWLPTRLLYPVAFSEILSDTAVDLTASFARHVWHNRYRENRKLYFNLEDAPPPYINDCAKRNPSVMVFCFVRDEPYLLSRWIPYHARIFGLEHILIIDHGSNKATKALLGGYAQKGMQLYDAGMYPFTEKGKVLSRVMRRFRHYRFLVPLDSDEFICVKTGAFMDCSRGAIIKAFQKLPEKPVVFKFGTYEVCNTPEGTYQDSLAEMTVFRFFPPEAEDVFSTHAPSKSFFPGKYFVSTDDGNHFGCIEHHGGTVHTGLALAHFHTRGFEHFLSKHAQACVALGVTDLEEYIRNKGVCHHWIARNLAISSGKAKDFFDQNLCALQGREEKAFSRVLKKMKYL